MEKHFTNEGSIQIEYEKKNIVIDVEKISQGINTLRNHFIIRKLDSIEVFERKCDHANGKLICSRGQIHCPLHGWIFNPKNRKYENVDVKKLPIEFILKDNKIIFEDKSPVPRIQKIKTRNDQKLKIDFIAHAFIIIKSEKFSFAMDPWATGPAFASGWWLKNPPTLNWKKKLNSCDFVYVSHNHPDHLNRHTLKHVKKEMLFIIPNFISKSVEKILLKEGFLNIYKFDFQNYYRFKNTQLLLTILKSGDFRDDSGLYFTFGEFSFLSTVDANNLNWNNFPQNITLFLSSFAGGASGYPLCHEQINDEMKIKITHRNKKSTFSITSKNVKTIKPKYFLPYAGFFVEKAKRDNFIKINNKKNSISEYERVLKGQSILNINKFNSFTFIDEKLAMSKKNDVEKEIDSPEEWIRNNLKNQTLSSDKVISYFKNSLFNTDLILFLSLTDDHFNLINKNFICDFSKKPPMIQELKTRGLMEEKTKKNRKNRLLFIKVREDSFSYVINNKLPWEHLSIGFQCKIDRIPDEYNLDFWHHFTNEYI